MNFSQTVTVLLLPLICEPVCADPPQVLLKKLTNRLPVNVQLILQILGPFISHWPPVHELLQLIPESEQLEGPTTGIILKVLTFLSESLKPLDGTRTL